MCDDCILKIPLEQHVLFEWVDGTGFTGNRWSPEDLAKNINNYFEYLMYDKSAICTWTGNHHASYPEKKVLRPEWKLKLLQVIIENHVPANSQSMGWFSKLGDQFIRNSKGRIGLEGPWNYAEHEYGWKQGSWKGGESTNEERYSYMWGGCHYSFFIEDEDNWFSNGNYRLWKAYPKEYTIQLYYVHDGSDGNPIWPDPDNNDQPKVETYKWKVSLTFRYDIDNRAGWVEKGGWIYVAPDAEEASGIKGRININGKVVGDDRKGYDVHGRLYPEFTYASPPKLDTKAALLTDDYDEAGIGVIIAKVITQLPPLPPSLSDHIQQFKERLEEFESLHGLNFDRELYTIGNRGKWVAWMNEQLAIIGAPYSPNSFEFTSQTYDGILYLKRYFKEVDVNLYNILELDNSCNENFNLTNRVECDGAGPCGCFSIGCAIFQEYTKDLSEAVPTDLWDEVLLLDSNISECKSPVVNIYLSPNLINNNVVGKSTKLMLQHADSISFSVKPGWELAVALTIHDNSTNANQYTGDEYWMDRGDQSEYRLRGGDIFGIGPGSNHRVGNGAGNEIFETHFKPGAARVSNPPRRVEQQLQQFGYNPSNCQVQLEIFAVRSPYNEWLNGGYSLPPGFGLVSGISGASMAAKALKEKITTPIEVYGEIRLGYELEVLFIFEIAAGVVFKMSINDLESLKVQIGYFVEAGAKVPDIAEGGMEWTELPFGYRLRWNSFSKDCTLMIRDLLNQLIPGTEYDFRTDKIEEIRLPKESITKMTASTSSWSSESTWIKKTNPQASNPFEEKRSIAWTIDFPMCNHAEITWVKNIDEGFNEIEFVFGLAAQKPEKFGKSVTALVSPAATIANHALTMTIAPQLYAGGLIVAENVLDMDAKQIVALTGGAIALEVGKDLFSIVNRIGDKMSLFSRLNAADVLPNMPTTSDFTFKATVGIKGKVRWATLSHADITAYTNLINNIPSRANPQDLISMFSLLDRSSASSFDWGIHASGSIKWEPDIPKVPLPPCGPLVKHGFKFSIEIGAKLDLMLSDFDLVNPASSWVDIQNEMSANWLIISGGGNW